MGAIMPSAAALVSSGDVPVRATVNDVTSTVIIEVTEPICSGFWQHWHVARWWAQVVICDILISWPMIMMRLRKRNAPLSSLSKASRYQQCFRLRNLRRSVRPLVAFVICLAVLGLASVRRRHRGFRAHTDSGGVHVTQTSWRCCTSEPADTLDWFFCSRGSSQKDEKNDLASSRLKPRSFSDSPADLTMYHRIDSILTEEDVNLLQLQQSLQRPLQPHVPQLERKQQFRRAATL
mmetsp:Transcript_83788/g.166250  ORF Transcript_83788/g.166250 Transcript_83788/m.166250 type:complete len:235 (+) Transcript_83788:64-768(+)